MTDIGAVPGTVAPPAGSPAGRALPFATRADVHRMVAAAVAAPSVHNTQPWRFRPVDDATMELHADLDRLLVGTDPLGRGLSISCGAALFNLRLAIRMTGHDARVLALPGSGLRSGPLATVLATVGSPPSQDERLLFDMIPHRRTNRWPFADHQLPADVVVDLVTAGHIEGATLILLKGRAARRLLDMVGVAEKKLAAEDAYRAELAYWTKSGMDSDGVPAYAFGPHPEQGELPLRDFTLGGVQPLTTRSVCGQGTDFEADPQIAALFTRGDDLHDWLCAGQALQRVLLTATAHGVSASMFSQPFDLRGVQHCDDQAGPFGHLQMLVRLGYGPPVPCVPRRSVFEVLDLRTREGEPVQG